MSDNILDWMGGNYTGSSSKAIALTALGKMPKNPDYPTDSSDFGRCHRLLKVAPEARKGLETLGKDGGDVWRALVARWEEIDAVYRSGDDRACYELMKSIINPIEDASGRVIRLGHGASIRF